MGFLDWLGRSAPKQVPSWAAPLHDAGAFAAFVDAVETALARRGIEVEAAMIRSGSVMLPVYSGSQREWILHELARRCAEVEPSAWLGIVLDELEHGPAVPEGMRAEEAPHQKQSLEEALRSNPRVHYVNLQAATFGEVAPSLRVQLFSPHARSGAFVVDNPSMVSRKISGTELVEVAMLQFPGALDEETLRSEDARRWGTSEEVLARGRDNIFGDTFQADQLVLGDAQVTIAISNGPYMSALALDAARLASAIASARASQAPQATAASAAHGYLVAVPNWHSLLLYELRGAAETRALLPPLREVVVKLFENADPLSPEVYWWRPSGWTLLTRGQDGALPAELTAILDA